jgi:histidyl-tRNA synthetase
MVTEGAAGPAQIQSVRGMNDILPGESGLWQQVEEVARRALAAYGYSEIRLPLLERTELFARSIGEATDIVEKEMYTFADRNGDSLTLRPEGTAGCVRAGIQNGLFRTEQRLWYAGPMFRHERPQKGRYRQFHQVGVEAYGLTGPDVDAEQLLLTARIWRELGLDDLTLEINSLGTPASRSRYRARLVTYLRSHEGALDEDSRRRLETNPLRVLDSKSPEMQAVIEGAPRLLDDLEPESREHLERLLATLEATGLTFRVNPRLVRGLDYYEKTVYEWTTRRLGAQATVCAGGRYDGLVAELGGRPTPAVGFAIGLERVVALLQDRPAEDRLGRPQAYLVLQGEQAEHKGPVLAETLRDRLPGLRLLMNCGGGSMKSQIKRADRSGAQLAIILAEAELAAGAAAVKHLRGDGEQRTISLTGLAAELAATLGLDPRPEEP